jgi:hypothetical protein
MIKECQNLRSGGLIRKYLFLCKNRYNTVALFFCEALLHEFVLQQFVLVLPQDLPQVIHCSGKPRLQKQRALSSVLYP